MPTRFKPNIIFIAGLVLLLGLLIIAPFITSSYIRHLLIVIMIYAVLASNWDLTLGYLGTFNFAHVAFFATGAYVTGIFAKTFGFSPWIGMIAGVLSAVLLSIIISFPVLRVKGLYVILATFAVIPLSLQIVMSLRDYTGGTSGLVSIPTLSIGNYSFIQDGRIAYYYLALLLLITSTLYLRTIVGSTFGISLRAIKDSEEYSVSRGIPIARQIILTFIASSIFTSLAGSIYSLYLSVASTELFSFNFVVLILSMVLLGGIGSIYGSILGAFMLTFLTDYFLHLGPWRFIILAIIIVLTMRFYPGGIIVFFDNILIKYIKPKSVTH